MAHKKTAAAPAKKSAAQKERSERSKSAWAKRKKKLATKPGIDNSGDQITNIYNEILRRIQESPLPCIRPMEESRVAFNDTTSDRKAYSNIDFAVGTKVTELTIEASMFALHGQILSAEGNVQSVSRRLTRVSSLFPVAEFAENDSVGESNTVQNGISDAVMKLAAINDFLVRLGESLNTTLG